MDAIDALRGLTQRRTREGHASRDIRVVRRKSERKEHDEAYLWINKAEGEEKAVLGCSWFLAHQCYWIDGG